jgi:single-strand DNA-binding protein
MSDINTVTLTGRLGSELELRYTPQGTAVTDVNLAVQSGFGDKEKTNWIGLTIWGKSAEAAANHLGKGQKIAVAGRLDQESWDQDGKPRTKTRVVCERWTFADGKRTENSNPPSNPPSEPMTTRNVHPDQNPNLSGDDIPF